jgi:hypothetical protein
MEPQYAERYNNEVDNYGHQKTWPDIFLNNSTLPFYSAGYRTTPTPDFQILRALLLCRARGFFRVLLLRFGGCVHA